MTPLTRLVLAALTTKAAGLEPIPHRLVVLTFDEDRNRTRKDHATASLGALRRIALSLREEETSSKVGVKQRRPAAAWNTDDLHKVLFG